MAPTSIAAPCVGAKIVILRVSTVSTGTGLGLGAPPSPRSEVGVSLRFPVDEGAGVGLTTKLGGRVVDVVVVGLFTATGSRVPPAAGVPTEGPTSVVAVDLDENVNFQTVVVFYIP